MDYRIKISKHAWLKVLISLSYQTQILVLFFHSPLPILMDCQRYSLEKSSIPYTKLTFSWLTAFTQRVTEAGNDPKVVGLVYIAAFAPDKGDSVSSLIKDPPPGAPVPPILPPQDGYLF